MGRPKRADDGGLIYHVLNRANARMTIFENDDDYEAFERVLLEVERNALRANLIERAEQWRWSSLYRRKMPKTADKSWLAQWPLERPRHWLSLVNRGETEAGLADMQRSVQRGCPFGEQTWSDEMVARLGLQTTVRPHGRPKKQRNDS